MVAAAAVMAAFVTFAVVMAMMTAIVVLAMMMTVVVTLCVGINFPHFDSKSDKLL